MLRFTVKILHLESHIIRYLSFHFWSLLFQISSNLEFLSFLNLRTFFEVLICFDPFTLVDNVFRHCVNLRQIWKSRFLFLFQSTVEKVKCLIWVSNIAQKDFRQDFIINFIITIYFPGIRLRNQQQILLRLEDINTRFLFTQFDILKLKISKQENF